MPDAPVDSLRMIFDPAVVSKFQDCGVMVLDSATDMLPAALKYLGLDPDSKKPEDLAKAADVMKAGAALSSASSIRRSTSTRWPAGTSAWPSASPATSSRRATAAPRPPTSVDIAYAIPKEGSLLWIDVAAIPKDAPNLANAYALPGFHAGGQGRRRVERAHRLRQWQQGGLRAAAEGRLGAIR